jgi:hypothetical protein
VSQHTPVLDAALNWSRKAGEAMPSTPVYYIGRGRNYAILDKLSVFGGPPRWDAYYRQWESSPNGKYLAFVDAADHGMFGLLEEVEPGRCLRIRHERRVVDGQEVVACIVEDVTDAVRGGGS